MYKPKWSLTDKTGRVNRPVLFRQIAGLWPWPRRWPLARPASYARKGSMRQPRSSSPNTPSLSRRFGTNNGSVVLANAVEINEVRADRVLGARIGVGLERVRRAGSYDFLCWAFNGCQSAAKATLDLPSPRASPYATSPRDDVDVSSVRPTACLYGEMHL